MKRADVKLETGEAKVIYDDSKQTPEKLAAAVDKLGFQASVTGVAAAPRPTLYVDGRRAAHQFLCGGPDSLTAESFIVGGPYFVANKTRTAIDELRLYSRALTADAIAAAYRQQAGH